MAGSLPSGLSTPHQGVEPADERERFTLGLLDTLWLRYRTRVGYAQVYERIVREAGGTFVNDHIAFRTFACQRPGAGLFSISRLFEALGYAPAGCYSFPDKHLSSIHYQHRNPGFPKIFISELRTWELSEEGQEAVGRIVRSHRAPVDDDALDSLHGLERLGSSERERLHKSLAAFFRELPWDPPRKVDLLELDRESQYSAWVAVHGYDVNHFTASVNSHGVEPLADIEKTVEALRAAGVPMKPEIEGERGSRLRQSATEAAVVDVSVRDGSKLSQMPWTYAYFELAERGLVADPATGEARRFEGFLGGQAAQLFEMTRRKG